MEELISLYHPDDLIPLIESFDNLNESIVITIQELVRLNTILTWVLGISITILAITIVLVFAVFLTNYSR